MPHVIVEYSANIEAELPPLYRCYVDDHIERLDAANRLDLADGFREWRARLLARAG